MLTIPALEFSAKSSLPRGVHNAQPITRRYIRQCQTVSVVLPYFRAILDRAFATKAAIHYSSVSVIRCMTKNDTA